VEVDLTGVVLDGRYRVLEPISEGAMGVVYRAERVKLGRIVAVKVLHDELPAELSSRKRFEIEATAMAKLEHPHCAAVIDVGIHEDKPFVVMDYVSGDNLRDVVAHGPLPLPRAVEIVRQVLTGLAHAHDLGIIHRDIKPANIVLSQKAGLGDHVKILDFGLARITDTPSLTSGIVVGTPAYMAPEQIRGTLIDARADLYACGVLLFELLTGHKPFVSPSDDPVELCSMHLKNPPPTLAAMQPGIEFGELEAIVARALAKSAADRYASAVEFAAALDGAVPRRTSSPPSAPIPVAAPMASPSGWVVPPDAKSSFAPAGASAPVAVPTAPASAPVTVPTAPAVPVAPASAPTAAPEIVTAPASALADSAPVAAGPSAPSPARRSGKQPPAPFRAKSRTYDPPLASDAPAAAPPAEPAASAPVAVAPPSPPPEPPRGLPASFDLSLAIPSPDLPPEPAPKGDTRLGLTVATPPPAKPDANDATRLGIGTAAPPPVADVKGETRLGLVAADEPVPAAANHDATSFFAGAPPAGPSPLEAADLPAVAEPIALPPPPTLPALPVTRKHLQIIGAVCGALLLISIIVGTCSSKRAPDAPSNRPGPSAEPSATPDPEAAGDLARATALADAGKHREAIELLVAARKASPSDPQLSYLLGKELFATKQWSEGVVQLRETIALDGTYRAEPELIRTVVAAFNASPDYPTELGEFLREIGPPVRQYLEETAAKHPRAAVRSRAKAELAKLR